MNRITKQQQQQQALISPPNGSIRRGSMKNEYDDEQKIIQLRINELEQELTHLKLRLSIFDNT